MLATTSCRGVRALVVDDRPALRRALPMRLKSEPDLEVMGEARNGMEAVDLACRLRPDVGLMDAGQPRVDGAEATRRIRRQRSGAKVVGLSAHDALALRMLEAGAAALVTKGAPLDLVVAAVRGLGLPRERGLSGRPSPMI